MFFGYSLGKLYRPTIASPTHPPPWSKGTGHIDLQIISIRQHGPAARVRAAIDQQKVRERDH